MPGRRRRYPAGDRGGLRPGGLHEKKQEWDRAMSTSAAPGPGRGAAEVLLNRTGASRLAKTKERGTINMGRKWMTFSFDDGTVQDRRLVALLDQYGLKGTFNLNSGLLARSTTLSSKAFRYATTRWRRQRCRSCTGTMRWPPIP